MTPPEGTAEGREERVREEIGLRFRDYWQDVIGQRMALGLSEDLAGIALVYLGADPNDFGWNHREPASPQSDGEERGS